MYFKTHQPSITTYQQITNRTNRHLPRYRYPILFRPIPCRLPVLLKVATTPCSATPGHLTIRFMFARYDREDAATHLSSTFALIHLLARCETRAPSSCFIETTSFESWPNRKCETRNPMLMCGMQIGLEILLCAADAASCTSACSIIHICEYVVC